MSRLIDAEVPINDAALAAIAHMPTSSLAVLVDDGFWSRADWRGLSATR